MRIDSHQHFWHYSPIEHAWMSDEMGLLKRDFLPEDLDPLLKSIGLDGCIAVQARQTLEETRLLELAEKQTCIHQGRCWMGGPMLIRCAKAIGDLCGSSEV
jgi:L-fuconolactonase